MDCSKESALEWKKMYLHMEAKLKQFRLQATSIRAKLSQKMDELSINYDQAEERAIDAEYQLNLLRENLAGVPGAISQEDQYRTDKIARLEQKCLDQQEQMIALKKELEYEKCLRRLEKETLQEKATRIKDWITKTLQLSEIEKEELRQSNLTLSAGIQAMQLKLTELVDNQSAPLIKPIASVVEVQGQTEDNAKTSILSSWKKNSIFDEENNKNQTHVETGHRSTKPYPLPIDNFDIIRTTPSSESTSGPEDSIFHMDSDHVISDEVGGKSPHGRFLLEGMSHVEEKSQKKKSSTLPMAKSASSSVQKQPSARTPPPTSSHHNVMGAFGSIRKKIKGLKEHHQRRKSHEEVSTAMPHKKDSSKSVSPLSTFSSSRRQSSSSPVSVPGLNSESPSTKTALPIIHQEEEDMAVDQDASTFSTSLPASTWKAIKPPTPPMHGLPVFESRIYEMTKNGFRFPSNTLGKGGVHKYSTLANFDYEPGEYAEVVYKQTPLEVPVYTKIKGRAAHLRATPFTDASDSSDDDHRTPLIRYQPRHNQPRPSKSLTMGDSAHQWVGMHQRKNGSPGLVRATKRANSQQSMASSEGDYAIPPDAQIGYNSSTATTDSSEPEHKLFKTSQLKSDSLATPRVVSPSCEENVNVVSHNKCGYLMKLGGRVRTWKKRWFVLKGDVLCYYKASTDDMTKPQGQIVLRDDVTGNSVSTIKREDSSGSNFQITSLKRTYYLSADNSNFSKEWVQVLQNVLDGNRSRNYFTAGWLIKTVGGSSSHVWAVIRDGMIECFEDEKADEMSVDRINLENRNIEETHFNLHPTLMANHNRSNTHNYDHVIAIRPIGGENGSRDVFLSYKTEEEKLLWLHQLTSSYKTAPPSTRETTVTSEFDRLVTKLLQADPKSGQYGVASPIAALWKNPVLSYSKQGLSRPLLIPSTMLAMNTEAMKIAKSTQLFVNVSLDAASADYHVTLAQRVAQSCLTHEPLRNEVYAQLIKLTNRRDNDMKENSFLQSWKFLSLMIPIFRPGEKILLVLQNHLKRQCSLKNVSGQYISYCQRALQRTNNVGLRKCVPSRTESLSILLQNPYHHSLPFSVPVHFTDGSYEVVSFDASTTVSEFSHRVSVQGGVRHHSTSGFALFVDDPDVISAQEHYIEPSVKICDVISSWETVSRKIAVTSKVMLTHDGANETRATARFSYRRRLTFKTYRKMETEKERLLITYQLGDEMSRDQLPLSRNLAIELTSFAAQMFHGDRSRCTQSGVLDHVMKRFLPARYRDFGSKNHVKQIRERINERWKSLQAMSPSDCARIFVNTARKWPLCGSTLFLAKVDTSGKHKGETVWLAVSEDCIHILNHKTMEIWDKCEYADIVTFGGCKNLLMVVCEMAGVSRKLFFLLPKVQMVELCQLMADYMNASATYSGKIRTHVDVSS